MPTRFLRPYRITTWARFALSTLHSITTVIPARNPSCRRAAVAMDPGFRRGDAQGPLPSSLMVRRSARRRRPRTTHHSPCIEKNLSPLRKALLSSVHPGSQGAHSRGVFGVEPGAAPAGPVSQSGPPGGSRELARRHYDRPWCIATLRMRGVVPGSGARRSGAQKRCGGRSRSALFRTTRPAFAKRPPPPLFRRGDDFRGGGTETIMIRREPRAETRCACGRKSGGRDPLPSSRLQGEGMMLNRRIPTGLAWQRLW